MSVHLVVLDLLDESFEDKESKMVIFANGEHPLELFFNGDYDTRANVFSITLM